ncbi:MAG: HIT family protein [Lachnospiraceae bacterium]|nr:HIT family protein [Lachnospiraceae bacterium]MDE6186163.1 HIT family protein [Lachnospiraceae bacterium]
MRQDNCIFCKIIAGKIPSHTLYEDEQFKVILDVGPATKGHALILPKQHYANLYELPEDTAADVMKLAKKMMKTMTDKLKCDGFNLVQNNGEVAGQTVFHFHMHLIPRYKNDGEILKYIAGEPDQEELAQTKKIITE